MIEKYLHGLEIKKDELTAIERNKLLNEGKEVDRIMCCLDTGETLAPMINCTLKEYYHSSEKMCQLEEYIYETFRSDGAGISCAGAICGGVCGWSHILYWWSEMEQTSSGTRDQTL